jgi:hypothetical protein
LLEIREKLPEGQAPSPSQAAFNKSFGTSYRGELFSVGCRAAGVGGGGSEILTLWKSPTLVDETGEGVSEKNVSPGCSRLWKEALYLLEEDFYKFGTNAPHEG